MFIADVWRGLFRHHTLDSSLGEIGPPLAAELQVGCVALRRLDLRERAMSTLALERMDERIPVPTARTECTSDQIEKLLGWTRDGHPLRGCPAQDDLLARIAGTGAPVDAMVAPLAGEEHGVIGVLVLLGRKGTWGTDDESEVARLIEPFRAALAASYRLQELGRLREVVEADNRALRSKLDRQEIAGAIVGADAGFREVMTRIEQVAPTDAPVLLLGETGTGKEVAARAIHERSRRSAGPMLRVNCGAIPPGLVDSELFGHERGSFTGAVGTRAGWFERADGGTLFLDELGELPLAAQVRLLRVLQEGVLERVGGQRMVPVDVRIVAATHRDLGEMSGAGTFRQDLWYRISVFPIVLPPLRDRRGDIPALVAHFAWNAGKRLGGQPLAPTESDLEMLVAYDWPGNVRELAAVIERAAIIGNGRQLEVGQALGPRSTSVPPSPVVVAPHAEDHPLCSLDEAIRRHIEAALMRAGGRIEGPEGAAVLLGINPHTLRSKMRKLGIRWQRFREAGRGAHGDSLASAQA